MANRVTAKFELDADAAIRSAGELGAKIEDTGSKGKQAALLLHAQADRIQADFDASVAAADALAAALGPEMANKIGQNKIDQFVADLKTAGLTADDIRADVDDLAGAIQHLDNVGKNLDGPKQGLQDVEAAAGGAKTEIGGMRGEADNSRSVLANMVGNSAQDVASLGGVAGTAGMALGQLGEYASEGNIKLANLAKVAGPMAAVTLVTYGISKNLSEIAATKAFNKKQIEDWTKAIREGKASVEDLAAAAADAGKIELRIGGDTRDLVPTLANLGLKAKDFYAAVQGGQPDIERFLQTVKDAGASEREMGDVLLALGEAHGNYIESAKRAGVETQTFGEKTEIAAKKQEALDEAAKNAAQTISDGVQPTKDASAAMADAAVSLDEFTRNTQAADLAYDTLTGKIDEADAWRKAQEAIYAFATNTAITDQDVRNLTRSLADYIKSTDSIPAEKKTKYYSELDQGSLGLVEQQLAALARNRTMSLSIVAKGGAGFGDGGADGGPRAAGGPTTPGQFNQVFDGDRPEIYTEGGKRYLLPSKPGMVAPMSPMGAGAGGPAGAGNYYEIHLHIAGHVMAERDLTRAVADGIVDGQRRGEITAGFLVSL